ncbi:MAG: TIGR02099 family protein, partial [Gammaproteobacteria bacterium]|nr:TIGR02099 family protein [Gammaproteobacteria bacterium]
KDLRYESRRFGEIRLETTRVANGLRIEQLVLKPKATTIIANGGWYTRGGKENSDIQIRIKTTNVGRTLKELGYVGTISGGKGDVSLDLQWPSALFDVDANEVFGSMKIFLTDGQLLDIDPGAGRLFGLLSLQTLPRRLFLDFSDVFSKGFGFSRIKGSFKIEDGDAYTNSLYLDGPSARVDISGRAGLVEQDYDQQVVVTPKVAESLPLLGALAATPQIGAAILFVQKIFQTGIDEATKTEYTITGNWSSPIVKKVKPSKVKTQPAADLFDEN